MPLATMTAPSPRWGPEPASTATLVVGVATLWVVMKLVTVWAWVIGPGEYGDTYYYFLEAQKASGVGGVGQVMREYPTPAALLLLMPYALGADDYATYRFAIVAMTSLADAAFVVLLGRCLGPVPVLAWIAITTSLGQLGLLRFDMLPAVVAGSAVLLAMGGRRASASAFLALGAGLKLWPIVLVPLTLRAGRRGRPRCLARPLVALASAGAALVALSVAVGGVDRLLSPLDYQRDRGLQIEAVAATVPMLTWAHDEAYQVWYSTFHAFEVTGPSVDSWLRAAQTASWVGLAGCVVLLVLWWRAGTPESAIGWLAITLVGTFVVTSRALSPQYLLWLAAPAVVILGYAWCGASQPGSSPRRRDRGADEAGFPPLVAALVTVVGILVLSALTTAVYPVYYGGVTGRGDQTGRALWLLATRNVGLLALVVWSAACAYFCARPVTKMIRGSGAG
ncbi:MAG: hypothetical protein IPL36_14495 [Nigerium sp.]|nr:hypothetical protein [Nigerium sp.]